jgi:hypothetical protein
MGASINAYWPGITEQQLESQPGFYNDDKAWANWMAELGEQTKLSETVKRLNAAAILTYKTDPMEDDEIDWVSPQQLRDAAMRLREEVLAGSAVALLILDTYEKSANRFEDIATEFIRDLDDIIAITIWSEAEGATRMTLEVNW